MIPLIGNTTDPVWRKIHGDVGFRKVHQKIMANNDDNRVFQFLLSMKFCFPLYRVPVRLENLRVRKIFEIELDRCVGLCMRLNTPLF